MGYAGVKEFRCYLNEVQYASTCMKLDFLLKMSKTFNRYWVFLICKNEVEDIKRIFVFNKMGDMEEDIPRHMTFSLRDGLSYLREMGVVIEFDDELTDSKTFVFPDCIILKDGKLYEYCNWNVGNQLPTSRPESTSLALLPSTENLIKAQLRGRSIPSYSSIAESVGFENAMRMLGME